MIQISNNTGCNDAGARTRGPACQPNLRAGLTGPARTHNRFHRAHWTIGSVLLAVLFIIGLAGTPVVMAAGQDAPGSPDSLLVVRQTVDIDYGHKITITAVVDSGTRPVDSVRALFRPRGGSTVWSYRYPEFVLDDEMMTVTFEISTGPGSYYPPGTEFDIEIELTHPDGSISAARSPNMVEYLDPAKDWKRMAGDGYTVVYYGVSNSDVADLIAETNSRIPKLRSVLGVQDSPDFPDFKAIVFPSVREATPSFPPVSQTATDQFLFAGFAQPQYRLFVQGQMNPTTFIHELAHLYTDEAVSSSLQTGLPSWLGEGLARFLETGSSSSSNARLRSSVRPDELLSIRHMRAVPGKRSDVFIFYPQAGAFVGYLVEEYGAETMADYLAAMNGGQPLLSGFEQIYGQSLYAVENEWRARFGASPLVIPSATPQPVQPADESPASTPVPLVDFGMGSTVSSESTVGPVATVRPAPVILPESTQQTPAEDPVAPASSAGDLPTSTAGESSPDYVVVGLVIMLLIVIGSWLYTSRRSKLPKRRM